MFAWDLFVKDSPPPNVSALQWLPGLFFCGPFFGIISDKLIGRGFHVALFTNSLWIFAINRYFKFAEWINKCIVWLPASFMNNYSEIDCSTLSPAVCFVALVWQVLGGEKSCSAIGSHTLAVRDLLPYYCCSITKRSSTRAIHRAVATGPLQPCEEPVRMSMERLTGKHVTSNSQYSTRGSLEGEIRTVLCACPQPGSGHLAWVCIYKLKSTKKCVNIHSEKKYTTAFIHDLVYLHREHRQNSGSTKHLSCLTQFHFCFICKRGWIRCAVCARLS